MEDKKKKGIFSLLWAAIKTCVVIVICMSVLAFLVLLGWSILPILAFAFPLMFIICIISLFT